MSHIKERKEKNCLNCNYYVKGRFCQHCGQENIVPKENFLHLVRHFFEDITHFDGKFFRSLQLLITKPGLLSTKYLQGKRASYLNPVRMYIFTSAVFFFIFLTFIATINKDKLDDKKTVASVLNKLEVKKNKDEKELKVTTDSLDIIELKQNIAEIDSSKEVLKIDSTKINEIDKNAIVFNSYLNKKNFKNVSQYDSFQNTLPIRERDGLLIKIFVKKEIIAEQKANFNTNEFISETIEIFLHRLPIMLFISLPLFAFLLHLLYIKQKSFYYVSHLIFSIHLYIFNFLLLLLFALPLKYLESYLESGTISVIAFIYFSIVFFYLYKSMHNFYRQGRVKTISKFVALNVLSFLIVLFLGIIFLVLSAFQI